MNFFLNNSQIEYILYHLNFLFDLSDEIKKEIIFVKNTNEINNYTDKIIFCLSDKKIDYKQIKTINDIPILFPISTKNQFYYFEKTNLIFEHDLLKSSFYLLSGYQEYVSKDRDGSDRFPYESSIQKKLGIIKKPIVNYYFEIISAGIKLFCEQKDIIFHKKQIFNTFGFMLTHDVDRINTYHFFEVLLKLKQFLGLTKSPYNKKTAFKLFINFFFHFINIFSKKNPDWSFKFLRKVERNNNFRSVFYFLHKDGLHKNSRYKFKEKRIKKLIKHLIKEDCEIGLHGTVDSATNQQKMKTFLLKLQDVSSQKIVGIRQHILRYFHPKTIIIQEKAGLKYDTTLGFAAHEGFRHSYCLPFKLYDFENERIIDVWEIPLNVMDVTVFNYRKLNFNEITNSINEIISEINKFHGVFTLLWHNSFFDEVRYKGITEFYENLLIHIKNKNPENILGKEILLKMNNLT